MAKRNTRERRLDIVAAIGKIERFLEAGTFESFHNDERTHDAVVRNQEIVSEASRHVPEELKTTAPHIPWRNIADIGNRLRHGYDNLNDVIVWDTIRRDLPPLLAAILKFLEIDSGNAGIGEK